LDVIVTFPKVNISGDYDLLIKLFGQNLDNKGQGSVVQENARARASLKASKYMKNGSEYLKFDKMRVKFQAGTIRQLKLGNLFADDQNLEEAANAFIASNSDFLLANIYPPVEKQFADILTSVANQIADTATFDELFPLN
jgi:hypothetical protein